MTKDHLSQDDFIAPRDASLPISVCNLGDSQLIRTIMENSSDTIYFKDCKSTFILNSKAHAKQFGYDDPHDLVGKSDYDFYPPEFAEAAAAVEQRIMRTGEPILGRVEKWSKANGESVWFSASKYPLYDANNQIVGTWGTSRDITNLKKAEEELERLNHELAVANEKLKEISIIDELSGLYNRRYFYETLRKTARIYARMRGRGYSATFSVLLIDIDTFKEVNDHFGHLVGDAAIRHVAHLLVSHIRSSDYAFRYGGDEFAIILPDTDRKGALELAERLRLLISETPLKYRGSYPSMTISLGTSSYCDQIDSLEMVQEADANLYESKKRGKNQIC